jgi:hypothetical protein
VVTNIEFNQKLKFNRFTVIIIIISINMIDLNNNPNARMKLEARFKSKADLYDYLVNTGMFHYLS